MKATEDSYLSAIGPLTKAWIRYYELTCPGCKISVSHTHLVVVTDDSCIERQLPFTFGPPRMTKTLESKRSVPTSANKSTRLKFDGTILDLESIVRNAGVGGSWQYDRSRYTFVADNGASITWNYARRPHLIGFGGGGQKEKDLRALLTPRIRAYDFGLIRWPEPDRDLADGDQSPAAGFSEEPTTLQF